MSSKSSEDAALAHLAEYALSPLYKNPDAERYVGRIVSGYGEIEFRMMGIVEMALASTPQAVRLFFRIRTEGGRVDVFDALCEPMCTKAGLAGDYSHILGAINHCKKLRNQYAHCTWSSAKSTLSFMNMQEIAERPERGAVYRKTDADLLREQFAYLSMTSLGLFHLRSCLEGDATHRSPLKVATKRLAKRPPLYKLPTKGAHPSQE
jgi:hypothetical protein